MGRKTLVIDDNEEFLNTLEVFLEATGFQVTAFVSADAAMNELSEDELRKFEFVITDFEMPGTKGDDFAVQMHLLNAESAIFVISGAIKNVSVEAAQIATLIEKPFSVERLIKKMGGRSFSYSQSIGY